jgi:hypothetical protein
MILLILGLFLLAAPLFLILFFQDKKEGFITVFFCWLIGETVLFAGTQALGVFSFWPVAVVQLFAVAAIGFFLCKRKIKLQNISVDWALIVLVIFSVAALWLVHFHYTGQMNLATDETVGYHQASGMVYPYPYFSDEWDAVGLINYSVSTHHLPLVNPLNHVPFFNILFSFYSLLAGMCLLLQVNPLFAYVWLSMFFNVSMIVVGCVLLRFLKLSKGVSLVSAMSLLFIVSAANLPGFWHLLPMNIGALFLLLGLCFLALKKEKLALATIIPIAFFYPAFDLFYGVALLAFFLQTHWQNKTLRNRILWGGIITVALVVFLAVIIFLLAPSSATFQFLLSKLWHGSFSGDFIPQYLFYFIIPLWSLVLFVFSLRRWRQTVWLLAPIVLGAVYWVFYSQSSAVILLEYERVVFLTSVLVVLVCGFGLQLIFDWLDNKNKGSRFPISAYIAIIITLCFFISLPWYTQNQNWKHLILINPATSEEGFPKAPANQYLTQDDLTLFSGISGSTFLSLPWKGLVVGVATGNTPVLAKEGTVSVGDQSMLDSFTAADCKTKLDMAHAGKMQYIYLYQFSCPGFKPLGESSEGLDLYQVQ